MCMRVCVRVRHLLVVVEVEGSGGAGDGAAVTAALMDVGGWCVCVSSLAGWGMWTWDWLLLEGEGRCVGGRTGSRHVIIVVGRGKQRPCCAVLYTMKGACSPLSIDVRTQLLA